MQKNPSQGLRRARKNVVYKREQRPSTLDSPDLQAPIIVAEWPASVRSTIRVTLGHDQGPFVDTRLWWWTRAGELKPGRDGIKVSTAHIRQLASALADAADEAERLGIVVKRVQR